MIDIRIFFKSIVLFTAIALIVYAVTPNAGIDFLLKSLAFAFGSSLLMPFLYPHVRGVRAGDEVRVILSEQKLPFSILSAPPFAVAMENGRIGNSIKVQLKGGGEEECIVVSYASLFSPAKVKILQKEIEVI